MEKIYYSYNHIHTTIAKSAAEIKASEFKADYILAIGAGGFIPARILRSYLDIPILTVVLSSYDENNQPSPVPVKCQWLDPSHIDLTGKKLLIVDEVDDTRATIEFCLTELAKHNPAEMAVYILHYKDKPKKGKIPTTIQHYFIGEEVPDQWICYPWDAEDIYQHDAMIAEKQTADEV